MKKMKKLVAILLTMAMVLGMSLTAFADTATITVENAKNATLKYVQVIEPEKTSTTGWKFSSDTIATAYKNALRATDDQTAIAMLIKYEYTRDNSGKNLPVTAPSIIKNATAATATQIDKALSNVLSAVTFENMNKPQTVSKAGVYAISASEERFTYKTMAAYVGFGVVENVYPTLLDATVTAKKAPTTVTKADDDANNAVVIGQKVTYTIKTTFPYFDPNATEKHFDVFDAITGAAYVGLVDDEATADTNEKTATVTIGGQTKEATFEQKGDSFVVDLSKYIDDSNTYANQEVVITYEAVVDEITVENEAGTHVFDTEYKSNKINLYTGKITLTKVDAEKNEIKLANAGFEVKLGDTLLTFEQKDTSKNVYTYKPGGEIKEVFTDANGEVVVEGLDIGTYTFVEKTAPEGYSINENPKEIGLDITDEGEANADGEAVKIYADADSIADTKLTALPTTGGIGTTIFTIVGCLIMVAAAGMFFVSRRREML